MISLGIYCCSASTIMSSSRHQRSYKTAARSQETFVLVLRRRIKKILENSAGRGELLWACFLLTLVDWSQIKAHLEQQERVVDGLKNGLCVVVECSFIEQFSDREVRSMAKQLEYSVVVNKRSEKPLALTFCSWRGDIASFCGKMGGGSWPVNRMEENVLEAFSADQLVVLSPDGPETLSELDPSKVYCIGGIVDRTTKKNVTKNWAEEHGAPSVRLPIDEFCPVPGSSKGHGKRHVLNINDVVTALSKFHVSGDWKSSLEAALPERKRRPDQGAKHKRRKAKADLQPPADESCMALGTPSSQGESPPLADQGNAEEATV
mmetsp:Transcript_20657/g.57354  ORF Transcript_20657/g.57354 Transcript_20657/m.57354 type:complete len:320 (-) Transcript_20657:158-1117(-)